MRYFGSARKGKRTLTFACFLAAIMAAALHLYAAFKAYQEADLAKSHPQWLGRVLHMIHWHVMPHARMGNAKDTGRSLWSAFGDHEWLRAVGVDVLLSAICLCCWSVVSNIDIPSLIKCSVFPWLDETQAAAEHTMDHIRDVTDEIYESSVMDQAKHAFSTAKDTAWGGSQDMKRRVSQLQATIGISDEDIDWQVNGKQTTRGRRGRPAKSPGRAQARGASANSAPSRSRSRASVSPVKRNASSRRSSRARATSLSSRRGSAVEHDEQRGTFSSTVEAVTAEAEVAGLTWGLFTIGGLGMGSAAVFGAEEVS